VPPHNKGLRYPPDYGADSRPISCATPTRSRCHRGSRWSWSSASESPQRFCVRPRRARCLTPLGHRHMSMAMGFSPLVVT